MCAGGHYSKGSKEQTLNGLIKKKKKDTQDDTSIIVVTMEADCRFEAKSVQCSEVKASLRPSPSKKKNPS
jgi:hypothetical protein